MGKHYTYTMKVGDKKLTLKDFKPIFDEYNKKYFYGKLGDCRFMWLHPKAALGKYMYDNGVSTIGFNRKPNHPVTDEYLEEVMIHEMIHMYVRTIENVKIDGVWGHGFYFKKHCLRLYKNYRIKIDIIYMEKRNSWWRRILMYLFCW